MAEFDLVVRGGEVATGFGTTRCDIGVKDGRIVALGEKLADGARVVDAAGTLVLPGGVDSHCHIEEPSRGGYASTGLAEPPLTVNEESFATASTAIRRRHNLGCLFHSAMERLWRLGTLYGLPRPRRAWHD